MKADNLKTILEAFEKQLKGKTLKGTLFGTDSTVSSDLAAASTAADETNNAVKGLAFWGYAALNPDAFKAMLPAISKWLVEHPTATMVELAEQMVTINPAVNAVNAYLSSFLSKDALDAGKAALEWSTDVTYTNPTGTGCEFHRQQNQQRLRQGYVLWVYESRQP